MICLYAAVGSAVAVITQQNGRWVPRLALEGLDARCLAADPARPERVYCGTFGRGLWVSDDAGATWAPVGDGITSDRVMAVAVSPIERAGGYGIVWAGTEPSALSRSLSPSLCPDLELPTPSVDAPRPLDRARPGRRRAAVRGDRAGRSHAEPGWGADLGGPA